MNDSSSNAQGQRSGVYASRKTGAATTALTPYKAIDLADVVSGQFDDEDAAEAVAEDLGDLKAAEGYLKDIETRAKGTDFASAGELAAKRIANLQALTTAVVLPSKPIAPMPAAIPDLTGQLAPNALLPNGSAPAAAPTAGEEMIRQLQGGSAPAPAAPTPAPAAPAPAAP